MAEGYSPLHTCATKCAVKMNLFYTLHLCGSTLGVRTILEPPGSDTGQSAAPTYLGSVVSFTTKQNLPHFPRLVFLFSI